MLEVALREDLPLPWLSLLVTVGLAPTLLWRRTHPFTVVAVAFGVSAVVDVGLIVADEPALEMYTVLYFLLLPYALFRWASGREVAGRALSIISGRRHDGVLGELDRGRGPGRRGGRADDVDGPRRDRALPARSPAPRRLEQVKAEERVGLARELHDTVAHHVSAIAIQAQAGRALAATARARRSRPWR